MRMVGVRGGDNLEEGKVGQIRVKKIMVSLCHEKNRTYTGDNDLADISLPTSSTTESSPKSSFIK